MTIGMVALALTLGLDVFAGGLSLGVSGLERPRWARTALIFAFFTFLMTTLGVLFGRLLGDNLGSRASYIAGAVLIVVGLRALTEVLFSKGDHADDGIPLNSSTIILTGIMVCLDKLAVGVALAFIDASITPLIAFLVIQSFIVTIGGIAIGKRLGAKVGELAETIAGLIFLILGVLIIYQTYTNNSYI